MRKNPPTERVASEATRQNAVVRFLRLIRFSHTVFALPFAFGALIVAADGFPSPRVVLLVLACMICARTAAMLFNRVADWSLDQRNPRTASRQRLISKSSAISLLMITSLAFVVFATFINRTAGFLSPVALVIIFFYSLTKRFTNATHFFLGLALAIAPAGAWIAQTGALALPPLVLGAAVAVWVAGFDLIYATQDYEFDRREGLHSLVVRLGIPKSMRLAQMLHVLALAGLIAFGISARLGAVYFASLVLVAGALAFEHCTARKLDVGAINRAFFQSNAFVSAVFVVAVCADRLLVR
jgi:4-hydroxybenzoate polyprenyltransferase